jgi:hypothetical protein
VVTAAQALASRSRLFPSVPSGRGMEVRDCVDPSTAGFLTNTHPARHPSHKEVRRLRAWNRDLLTIEHGESYAEMHAKYQCPDRPGDP